MAPAEDCNCLFCGELFIADGRNAKHQKYCTEPNCRKASKAASRLRWLAKAENQDYFRGAENVARMQAWRVAHPGYWRRPKGQRTAKPDESIALQDLCPAQHPETKEEPQEVSQRALQDLLIDQPAVLIGFIAQLTGYTLQDDIVQSVRRLLKLGHDILAGRIGDDHQTRAVSRADPADSGSFQLARPPPGSPAVHRAL